MTAEPADQLAPRVQRAVDELERLILERYPDAAFRVAHSPDDPAAIHLLATVDLEDTDAVLDTVVERMMEIQFAQGIPIFVIPLRPTGRVESMRAASR